MISSLSPPGSARVPWCPPRSAGSSPPGPGFPPGAAETGTEPIIVINVIAEPAAARCRPALLVRRIDSPIFSRSRGYPAPVVLDLSLYERRTSPYRRRTLRQHDGGLPDVVRSCAVDRLDTSTPPT